MLPAACPPIVRRILILSSLSAVALLPACSEPASEAAVTVVHPAKVYRIEQPGHSVMRRFPAQVQAADRAPLAFRVSGELMTLPVKAGQEVHKGDVLARLDPADYQLQVDDRKARHDLARSQFSRIDDLYRRGQVSKSQYDQAKAELDISQAALSSARTDLAYTTLKAPYSGVVAEVYADNHQPVSAGNTIVVMQAKDQLEIRLQVPESLMAHISRDSDTNYRPEVEFEALPGQRFRAAYEEHTAQADPATGSFTITLTMPRPPSLNVLPGMSASVHADMSHIISPDNRIVMVPPQAVFQSAQQPTGTSQAQVWIVSPDMTISARTVEVGQLSTAGIEVITGLQPGETILAAGVHQAHAGMRIRPWVKERGL